MSLATTNFVSLQTKLYDFEQPGVVLLREMLSPTTVSGIQEELVSNRRNHVPRPTQYGTTSQMLHSWDFERAVLKNYEHLSVLDKLYEELSRGLHSHMPKAHYYDRVDVNSSLYPKGSIGIGPHRDNSFSVNFTVIAVISGENSFFTAQDKERNGEVEFQTEPGDFIVLRGPRTVKENRYRPVHYVGEVKTERYIIVFREINTGLLQRVAASKQYNG